MVRIRFAHAVCSVLVLGLLALVVLPTACAEDKKVQAGPANKQEADVFGYTAAFDQALNKLGEISPEEFAKRYSSPARYLERLTWDPTTARFYKEFNTDPLQAPKKWGFDFRLNAEEAAAFKKNGFVVSERMGGASHAEIYYRIYTRDLPVFISSDSLLHAWHRTYDAMLEEIEQTYLSASLGQILEAMAAQIPAAQKAYGQGILADSLTDSDYYLAVARSLLAGKAIPTQLKQDDRVAKTLAACDNLQLQRFNLFGRERVVDFSQFKVRGHYENSDLLKKYFKAMMWCGRIDLRIAGGNDGHLTSSSPRELGAALVLNDLLHRADQFKQWQQFDRMIQTFVGRTDSMTFAQLDAVLHKGKVASPADVKNWDTLTTLQKDILAGKIGLQHIRSAYVESSPFGPDKAELPRSFTFLGQKFVLDSWATAKVVADDVMWNGRKVQRRVPSGLDVAFSVLGNDQVVPLLVERIKDKKGRAFRDGLFYQHNLAAVRTVIDSQNKDVWDENLYMNWLGTLRELSRPTTDQKYPEVMRTAAWANKSLNTQLASWTQLRHDTILYVKQSYTAGASCYYPHGFVEPVPEFWARLERMAARSADLIEKTDYPGRLAPVQKKQVLFLKNFAAKVGLLRAIASKELAQKELTAEETRLLQDVVQIQHGSGFTRYNGWYPGLFYKGPTDCGKWDAIVADVHTDVPAPPLGDPGCVLTEGVGNVDLLLIAIDNGKDRVVYAGPTLSHYEFEMPGMTRKADSEWRDQINKGQLPPRPAWTRSYLVPGENKASKFYRFSPN